MKLNIIIIMDLQRQMFFYSNKLIYDENFSTSNALKVERNAKGLFDISSNVISSDDISTNVI